MNDACFEKKVFINRACSSDAVVFYEYTAKYLFE